MSGYGHFPPGKALIDTKLMQLRITGGKHPSLTPYWAEIKIYSRYGSVYPIPQGATSSPMGVEFLIGTLTNTMMKEFLDKELIPRFV